MTGVDREVVGARLALMRELLADLELIGHPTAAELTSDRIRRHATERVLAQLVELAVSVNSHIVAVELGRGPASYRESFSDLARTGAISPELAAELAPSAALRNVLTHEYVDIDLELVAAAIPGAVSGYTNYIQTVAAWLLDR